MHFGKQIHRVCMFNTRYITYNVELAGCNLDPKAAFSPTLWHSPIQSKVLPQHNLPATVPSPGKKEPAMLR
ncbi:hypothetical protein XENTR_v10020342 [Xenopus tropicalis]|nr:hypothetical protein XENTR_v10020342 [Xenopus tropicalis]